MGVGLDYYYYYTTAAAADAAAATTTACGFDGQGGAKRHKMESTGV